MSHRHDTPWIAGAHLHGVGGLGVLGSTIPAAGTSGPAYAYNDLSLPADADKEICGLITQWPSAGTLTADEDTSFTFTGPDGTAQYQLYVDGVATGGPATIALEVGVAVDTAITVGAATLTLTGYAPTVTRTAGQALSPAAGAITITGYAPSIVQGSGQTTTTVSPAAGALTLTGFAPTVEQTGGWQITPGAAQIDIIGWAPTLRQTGQDKEPLPDGGSSGGRRRTPQTRQRLPQWHIDAEPEDLIPVIAAMVAAGVFNG